MLADFFALGIAAVAFGEACIEPKLLVESPTFILNSIQDKGNAQKRNLIQLIG